MKLKTLALACASLLSSVAAADISYGYFQLGLAAGDTKSNFAPTFDNGAFILGGSFEVGESFFIQLDSDAVVTDDGADFAVTGLGGSIGFHYEFTEDFSGWVRGGIRKSTIEDDFAEYADDQGTEFGAGLRFMVNEALELNAVMSKASLGDVGDRSVIGFGGVFMVGDSFGLTLDYTKTSYSDFAFPGSGLEVDFDMFGAGLRFVW